MVSFSFAAVLITLSAVTPLFFSLAFLALACISISIINILIFSLIMQVVEERLVGRVITVLTSFAGISMPFGGLLGGAIASAYSPVYPVIICGCGLLLFCLYWFLNPTLRKLPKVDDIEFMATPETLQENNAERTLL